MLGDINIYTVNKNNTNQTFDLCCMFWPVCVDDKYRRMIFRGVSLHLPFNSIQLDSLIEDVHASCVCVFFNL